MVLSPFKTPQRLAVFLAVLAVCLFAAVHLVLGWLWTATEEARRLREDLDEVGIELRWETAERDLGLNLVLGGVEVAGLPVGKMILGGDLVALREVRFGAGDLGLLSEIMESLARDRLVLEGTLGIGYGLDLVGRWRGWIVNGGLCLAGEAVLSRRGRRLEVESSFHLTEGAVYLVLETEKSLMFGRLDPGFFLFFPRLETTELTGLWGGDPLQAKGPVCGLAWPDEDHWLGWSSGVSLRRRGAPEEFSTGPFFFSLDDGDWTAWLAELGVGRGMDGELVELALRAELDVRHLARSILPLGSTGAGRVECEVLLDRFRDPSLSLTADSVSLTLPNGLSLFLEGELGFRDGVPRADCRFDTGGGWLDYRLTEGGRGVLTGKGIELSTAWLGGLLLRDTISPIGGHIGPLVDPASLAVELTGCRWNDLLLGDVGGVIERGVDGWTAELTLTRDGGRADCNWRFDAHGNHRVGARIHDLPLDLVRILGAGEAGVDPTAGRVEGTVELTLLGGGLDSLKLNLLATGVEASLPPFLASLWRWADTGVEPPRLRGAELELTWSVHGGEPGEMSIRLTSADLRVILNASSRAAWSGTLDLSGRLEVPSRLARRMSERGVLVFRTPSGWGAIPFHLGGTWADPQPRLDLIQSRLLAASEPPPGTVGW